MTSRAASVHGAFATSGPSNLHAAAYFPDLTALYGFLSRDLVGLGITQPELRAELVQHVASHRVRDQLGRFEGDAPDDGRVARGRHQERGTPGR
ncbi:hypothetical protein [Streptomyces mirabilis]|uniref:hypothetical protein n=1 Tax=Streptomyces mirabilis TaxID=68239 RepID=UPI0036DDDA49